MENARGVVRLRVLELFKLLGELYFFFPDCGNSRRQRGIDGTGLWQRDKWNVSSDGGWRCSNGAEIV